MKKKMLILAAIDLTEDPEFMFREMSRVTGGIDASVYFIHVLKDMPRIAYRADANRLWEEFRDRAMIDTLVGMKAYIRRFSLKYGDIEPIVDVGNAAEVIARAADRLSADLVVVGNRPVSGSVKIFRRGTAERVVRLSAKPVLSIVL